MAYRRFGNFQPLTDIVLRDDDKYTNESTGITDKQNEKDPAYGRSGRNGYKKMSDDFENSIAFAAACDLVFKGGVQPSGYTEPLLHKRRLEKKS